MQAAEESYKAGRKSKDLMNTSNVETLRNSSNEITGKMNGNPQSYLSHGDSQSPSNSSSMHLGSQNVSNQYQLLILEILCYFTQPVKSYLIYLKCKFLFFLYNINIKFVKYFYRL